MTCDAPPTKIPHGSDLLTDWIPPFLQLLAVSLAGAALFLSWRSLAARGRAVLIIVTTGFLLRALAGPLIFWISLLHLPVARSHQLGDGVWFYASDALTYLRNARHMTQARDFRIPDTYHLSSGIYLQILAVAMSLFGQSTATSLLLNVAAFLGTCAALLSTVEGTIQRRHLLALVAISLMPMAILWTLQPLKDSFFVLFIATFAAAARRLFRSLNEVERVPLPRLVANLTFLAVCEYAVTGMRWYVGLILLVALGPGAIVTILTTRHRRIALGAFIVLFPVLVLSLTGGEGNVPRRIVAEALHAPVTITQVRPRKVSSKLSVVVQAPPIVTLDTVRAGFNQQGGNTLIENGAIFSPGRLAARAPQRVVHMLVGGAAIFLPRGIAQGLGILRIGGDRYFWLLAEADTLMFDLLLIAAIVCLTRVPMRPQLLNPTLLLVVLSLFPLACLLAYTGVNMGTLIRYREMITIGLALVLTTWTPPLTSAQAENGAVAPPLPSPVT